MASMYTVSTPQLILATVLSALISAGSIVGYTQFKEQQALPQVQTTADGTCVKVLNFKNGEAYNCEDVDVVLRQYKKVLAVDEKPKEKPPEPAA
jgi:hypothetical protein